MTSDVRVEAISKLDLQPGDILLVRVGGELGGVPWVPSFAELEEIRDQFAELIPDSVKVILSHHLLDVVKVTGLTEENEIHIESNPGPKIIRKTGGATVGGQGG